MVGDMVTRKKRVARVLDQWAGEIEEGRKRPLFIIVGTLLAGFLAGLAFGDWVAKHGERHPCPEHKVKRVAMSLDAELSFSEEKEVICGGAPWTAIRPKRDYVFSCSLGPDCRVTAWIQITATGEETKDADKEISARAPLSSGHYVNCIVK